MTSRPRGRRKPRITMSYEVEQKFPCDDLQAIETRLLELGAEFGEPLTQSDTYYAHPSRDFAKTDEALRIRQIGERHLITYKGPKLDSETKTRREIELPLGDSREVATGFHELLEAIGFRPVVEVRKQRRVARLRRDSFDIEVALDEVSQVGRFVEIEATATSGDELDAARGSIRSLAEQLGLRVSERRSYLELLLGGD